MGSNRCCKRADEHGSPECCYQLVKGDGELTFTWLEVEVLVPLHRLERDHFVLDLRTGMFTYAGDMTEDEHRECLHTGWMSQTLECASHPLRPIVGESKTVLGTVAIDGCNTELEFERYSDNRDEIGALWQVTVDLFGVKPYYCNRWIKKGWYVL